MKIKHSFSVGRTVLTVTCALSALLTFTSFNARAGDGPRIPVATATDSGDDGHVAANAIDDSLATRWSAEGDGQWLDLDLGLPADIGGVHIAWYQGNKRTALFEILTSNNGATWTRVFEGVSSGTTTNFESYALTASTARYVRILGHGNSKDLWNSIEEAQVFAPGSTPPPPPPQTNAVALTVQSVSASTNDPGDVPANTLDGKFSTRWSAYGDGQWIAYKLAATDTIGAANIAFYKGNTRIYLFDVQTSASGSAWQTVLTGASSGVSSNYETFQLTPTTAQYVRIVGHGNSQNLWNSMTEVRWLGTNGVSSTNASAPVAAFGSSLTQGQAPLAVQFTDESTGSPAAWSWNFGDSTTSTAQNPLHTYNSAGSFTATLTVTGSGGQNSSVSHTITVTNATAPSPVTAAFSASPVTGLAPLTVTFVNQSTGSVASSSWNFGDGSSSTAQTTVSHIYTTAGSYTATLTVRNSAGSSSSASHTITVTNSVAPAPVTAAFVASPVTGVAPLTVQFTNQSTGPVTSWNWNFGDGSSSTAQNASHTYSTAGSYTVTLTVQNSAGASSSKSTVIQVNPLTVSGTLPGQILNLSNWKLTLPTGSAGSPTEITQPSLATFSNPNYFTVDPAGDGVVFTANCGGVTTSGSSYPRSELREMANNGSTTASWSTTSGISTMEITEAITHTPVAKPQVIAGQVHDGVTKVIDCRLNGSTLYIENASGGTVVVLDNSYQLGTKFTIKWVAQNGGIAIYFNGNYITTYSVSDSGCYFKSGAYTQSNTSHGDAATAYGQVIVYSLSVTHQ